MLQTTKSERRTHYRAVLSNDAFIGASLHIIRGASLDMRGQMPSQLPTLKHTPVVHQPSATGTKIRSPLRWTSSATASGLRASTEVSCATD